MLYVVVKHEASFATEPVKCGNVRLIEQKYHMLVFGEKC